MIGVDVGAGDKLCIHDANGPREVPKTPRGLIPPKKFAEVIRILLDEDDVTFESPTVGSSGVEVDDIRKVIESAPHTLYTLSARAVKNFVKDHDLGEIDDTKAAEIIYTIASIKPASLQVWRYRDPLDKTRRVHTSVRPYDKRNYKDPQVDYFMGLLPPFETLPARMQAILGNGKVRKPDYAPARVMPFAMALTEPGAESRDGYLRIIGNYAHGYPSFYRRASVSLMQRVAKDIAGVSTNVEVSPAVRKQALKETTKMIKTLYHMSKERR